MYFPDQALKIKDNEQITKRIYGISFVHEQNSNGFFLTGWLFLEELG